MHGYLLCIVLVVVASACDHKDMFMEHVSCGEGFFGNIFDTNLDLMIPRVEINLGEHLSSR
jgi:hypothetical protein